MCCYLFSAFSMKRDVEEGISEEQLGFVRLWRRTILQISIEEMLHMCLACNLLTAVGGAPHLRRPNLPVSPKAYPPSFKLELVPFCRQSLANFIFIERPEDLEPGAEEGTGLGSPFPLTPKLSDIFSSAREYQNQGRLYRGIEDGLQYPKIRRRPPLPRSTQSSDSRCLFQPTRLEPGDGSNFGRSRSSGNHRARGRST